MQCPESAVQQWFSGDPKGSARELRNSDFGLGIQQSEPGAPATGHDSRATSHEPHKSVLAKRTQLVARRWRSKC